MAADSISPVALQMNALDGLWHLLGFVAPAIGTGCLLAAMAKALWRRQLRSASLVRLCSGATLWAVCAFVAISLLLGRDGTIAAYAAMLFGAALRVGWSLLLERPS